MTPANERLRSKIHSIRGKIFTVVRELEDLGVGPEDVPAGDFNAVAEAIGLLEGMAQAYARGDELPDLAAAKMEEELQKTEFIAQHYVGRMIAYVARARGISVKSDRGVAGIRCPCGSGKTFPGCCGSGSGCGTASP